MIRNIWHKLLISSFLLAGVAQAEMYIEVLGANVKKAKLAMGKVHPLPDGAGTADPELAKKIETQLESDLQLVNLFEFIPHNLFANHDQAKDVRTVRFDDWTNLGTSFVLKLGYKVQAGKLNMEAFLFDIPGKKKIFSTRYSYSTAQYVRLVHALAEDVMKNLTGEKGLFNSRLLMSCRDLKRRKSPPKEIYIMDSDGRNVKQLTTDETLSLSPSWAPNSRQIAYTQFEFRVFKGIRKKGMVLKKHDLTTGQRVLISAQEGMNSGAAWRPDGGKIAATLSFSGRPEIYLLEPNITNSDPELFSRRIQWKKFSGEGFQASSISLLFDVEPNWAPDGKKMVISSARTGHPMIYVVDVGNMSAQQLTFAGTYNASPSWSPKGDKIVFAAQRLAEGNFDLYLIDPDGNNLTRLTIGDRTGKRKVNSENPTWAPTGRHIAYAANEGGNYGVYVMATDGTGRRKVSPPDKECFTPAWSPAEG